MTEREHCVTTLNFNQKIDQFKLDSFSSLRLS